MLASPPLVAADSGSMVLPAIPTRCSIICLLSAYVSPPQQSRLATSHRCLNCRPRRRISISWKLDSRVTTAQHTLAAREMTPFTFCPFAPLSLCRRPGMHVANTEVEATKNRGPCAAATTTLLVSQNYIFSIYVIPKLALPV